MIQPDSFRVNLPAFDLPALIVTSSAEETIALGQSLAVLAEESSVFALRGPLGAGKTCLAKGIARGLGIEEELSSPTYTIVSEYALAGGKTPFYHIDAYRLSGNDDFSAIGGEDIVFGNGISVIEWSERIPDFVSPQAIKIDIEIIGDDKRRFRIYKDKPPHGEE